MSDEYIFCWKRVRRCWWAYFANETELGLVLSTRQRNWYAQSAWDTEYTLPSFKAARLAIEKEVRDQQHHDELGDYWIIEARRVSDEP